MGKVIGLSFLASILLTGCQAGLRPQSLLQPTSAPVVASPTQVTLQLEHTAPNTLQLTAVAAQEYQVDGIQLVADLTGRVPSDIVFTPAALNGLQPVINSIEPKGEAHELRVVMLTTPPTPFTLPANTPLVLGTINADNGFDGLTVTFTSALSKVVQNGTAQNLLQTVSPFTF